MAPRASTRESAGKKSPPADFDYARIPGIVQEIEEAQEEVDDIMAAAQAKCQPLRDRMNDIKKAVRKDGCPGEVLNQKIAERKDLRKAEGRREKLSAEQQDKYDRMTTELGDFFSTGLGAAAASSAKH